MIVCNRTPMCHEGLVKAVKRHDSSWLLLLSCFRRTLANFQCRRPTYYMQTQVQQCTKFISGWFNGKDSCLAAIKLWPQFQQQAANSSSGYSTYGMYGYYNYYDSNQYAGFCSSFQGEAAQQAEIVSVTCVACLSGSSVLQLEPGTRDERHRGRSWAPFLLSV